MNTAQQLAAFGLDSTNSIVIGSGILQALGIRTSQDLDVTVPNHTYQQLNQDPRLTSSQTHGRPILVKPPLEIGTSWGVLGKNQSYDNLIQHSVIIDGVRYISLEFLLAVKQSWLQDAEVRPKDRQDVKLINAYITTKL
jgi:hypothetical protein